MLVGWFVWIGRLVSSYAGQLIYLDKLGWYLGCCAGRLIYLDEWAGV